MTKLRRIGFWALAILALCVVILTWVRLHGRPTAVAAQAAPTAMPELLAPAPAVSRPPLPTEPPPEIVRKISAWSPPPPPMTTARAVAGGKQAAAGIANNASVSPTASQFLEPKKVLTLEELQHNGQ